MRIVGLIPARAGSKGVPNKNIRLLGGRPLISYTIRAALESRINRTIVSTDSEEIASVAKRLGAEVPFLRPKELATDTASSLSVILHALHYLEEEERYSPDVLVFLPPTMPFRTCEHINAGLELLLNSSVDSVIGICEVDHHPYFMYKKNGQNDLEELIKMENKPLRRQDLPPIYRISDGLIINRRSYFDRVSENSCYFNPKNMKGLLMDRISSIDINDEFDFSLAEFIIKSGLFQPR